MTTELLLALALGYLLGSIPFGLVLTRLAGKGDVRDIGSGNMNVFVDSIPDFAPAFEKVKAVLTRHGLLDRAVIQKTTYQDEGDDEPAEEAVVWPENFTGVFRLF